MIKPQKSVWKFYKVTDAFNFFEVKRRHYNLNILRVQYDNGGEYECEGMANNLPFIAKVTLYIRGKLTLTKCLHIVHFILCVFQCHANAQYDAYWNSEGYELL